MISLNHKELRLVLNFTHIYFFLIHDMCIDLFKVKLMFEYTHTRTVSKENSVSL